MQNKATKWGVMQNPKPKHASATTPLHVGVDRWRQDQTGLEAGPL